MEEVAQHNSKGDAWFVINNVVYDVSDFILNEHPGGAKLPMRYAGKDATETFESLHSKNVIKKHGGKLQTIRSVMGKNPTPTQTRW